MLSKSISTIFRKPSILIFLGIVFVFIQYGTTFLGEFVNTIFTSEMAPNNIFEFINTIATFISLVINNLNTKIILQGVALSLSGIVILSGILAIGFSGYFNTVFKALDKEPKRRHDYINGIKKYFLKTWVITCLFLLISFLTLAIALVAIIPSLFILNNAGDSNNYLIIGIVLGIITLIVLFFTVIYYTMYMSFWYPAVFSNNNRPFLYAVKMVDRNFFGIFVRLFFTIIFLLTGYIIIDSFSTMFGGPFSITALIIKWIFNTLFFAFYTTYVFSIFRVLDRRAQN